MNKSMNRIIVGVSAMINLILTQIKTNKPIVSALLIFSCCVATIPQFILDNTYSFVTGQTATFDTFYIVALNAFTHSPDILVNHFMGNLLVIIVFGIMAETLIGSERFAFVTILSFVITTSLNYMHSTGGLTHGASGLIWGYHSVYIVFLITYLNKKGSDILKNYFILFANILFIFDLVGIMILEVVVLHRHFFENFGQVLHIASLISVVPFIILWKKDISNNIEQYIENKAIEFPKPRWRFSLVFIFILAVVNLYGVAKVILSL